MTALLVAARCIHFLSLMLIFGSSGYAFLLRRAGLWRLPDKGTRLLFATAILLAIVTAIAWFCLVCGEMSGSWQGSVDPATIELAATGTRFGHLFLGRIIGLAALGLLFTFGKRLESVGPSILAGLLLASAGPVSHAAASGRGASCVGAISDAAHVLTAGFWLGGLVTLAIVIRNNGADRSSLLGALRIFSIWGAVAVAILVISGLLNALLILPIAEMSLRNAYFDWLVVKVGLASAMIALAAVNRWQFAPALRAGGERARQQLATSVQSEIALGSAVVVVAGLLGLTAPH